MQTIRIPSKVHTILRTLTDAGYEAYAVGGCVRDSLIGRVPGDWDVTTSALPEETKKLFRRTVDTGIAHGTVTVMLGNEGFEVTTYRLDGDYSDSRHPDKVSFTSSLAEDLRRRDFTVNAMAYHPDTGIVDLFGGMEDLKHRIIRAVGDPMERFDEDALRILRAVRFSAQLGFDIEEKTFEALRHFAPRLSLISAERIREELTKLICSANPERFRLLHECGITAVILPIFDEMLNTPQHSPYHCYNVGEHTLKVLAGCRPDPVLRWTALLHDTGKVACHITVAGGRDKFPGHAAVSARLAEQILKELRFDNSTVRQVTALIAAHDDRLDPTRENVRRELNKLGADLFPYYIEFLSADNMAKNETAIRGFLPKYERLREAYRAILSDGDCCFLKDLAVTGADLIRAGVKPGPAMGDILRNMLDDVLADPAHNTKDYLLAHFLTSSI